MILFPIKDLPSSFKKSQTNLYSSKCTRFIYEFNDENPTIRVYDLFHNENIKLRAKNWPIQTVYAAHIVNPDFLIVFGKAKLFEFSTCILTLRLDFKKALVNTTDIQFIDFHEQNCRFQMFGDFPKFLILAHCKELPMFLKFSIDDQGRIYDFGQNNLAKRKRRLPNFVYINMDEHRFSSRQIETPCYQQDQLSFSRYNITKDPFCFEVWTYDTDSNELELRKTVELSVEDPGDQRLRVYIQRVNTFFHAAHCKKNDCLEAGCSENKSIIQHANKCKNSVNQCAICIDARMVGRKHYRLCRQSDCNVPYCFNNKFRKVDLKIRVGSMIHDALYWLNYKGDLLDKDCMLRLHKSLDTRSSVELQALLLYTVEYELSDDFMHNFAPNGLYCTFKNNLGCRVPMRVPEQLSTITWFAVKRAFSGKQCPLGIAYFQQMPQRVLFNSHSSYHNF